MREVTEQRVSGLSNELSLLVGYALLGATFLIMKTEGLLQERMFAVALPLGIATLAAVGVVSIWTPFSNAEIARRRIQNDVLGVSLSSVYALELTVPHKTVAEAH